MKKYFVLLIFLIVFSFMKGKEIVDSSTSIVVVKSYELKGEAWNDWKKIEDDWMKNNYPKILKSNKLKMNCRSCESIYLEVVIQIDSSGKLNNYKLINSKKCGEKFSKSLEIQFMKPIFNIEFPHSLKNMRFEIRLGTGLKC